jgi:hypothetical protein
MFPQASFDPTRILPLTSNEFILRILVPEVALRLIMEDRDLEGNNGMHEALVVLRESSTYGVAMFPEDGGDGRTGKKRRDDAMFVGDKIVMERARKRRKELEEEEEQEEREEARRIAEMEAGVETPVKKMGGKKQKGKQREEQQPKEQTKDKVRKPSSTRAASSDLAELSLGSSDSDASLGSRRSTKSTVRRSTRKNTIEKSKSTMDVDPYDCFGGDEDDVNLEVKNSWDIKTPVHKQSRSFDYKGAKDTSNDEQTPKPLLLPLVGGSNNNIKPLMIARTRQSQKDSE